MPLTDDENDPDFFMKKPKRSTNKQTLVVPGVVANACEQDVFYRANLLRPKSQVSKRQLAEYLGRVVYGDTNLLHKFAGYWGMQAEDNKYQPNPRTKNCSSAMAVEAEGVIVDRSLFLDLDECYFHPNHYRRMRTCMDPSFSPSWTEENKASIGQFGSVFHAVDNASLSRKDPVWFAEKLITTEKFKQNEIKILCFVSHENIIKVYGATRTNFGIHIFMQLAAGGNLDKLITKGRGFARGETSSQLFTEYWGMVYFTQVLKALQYLKGRHIVHCDVKPRNIVLSTDLNRCFLTDFGEAQFVPTGFDYIRLFDGPIGTQQFMSPEVIRDEKFYYGSDVWSAGCSLLNMLTGRLPWSITYPNVGTYYFVIGSKPEELLQEFPGWLQSITSSILRSCFAPVDVRKPIEELLMLSTSSLQLLSRKYQSQSNPSPDLEPRSKSLPLPHDASPISNRSTFAEEGPGVPRDPTPEIVESVCAPLNAEVEVSCTQTSSEERLEVQASSDEPRSISVPISCESESSDDQESPSCDESCGDMAELDRLIEEHSSILGDDDAPGSDPSKNSINHIAELNLLLESENLGWVFNESEDTGG